jgi:hypothetical protein
MVWTHNFISSSAYRLRTATEKMATTKRNHRCTSVLPQLYPFLFMGMDLESMGESI